MGSEHSGLHFPQVDCGLKIVDEGVLALNAAVGQLADLLRVESFPGLSMQVLVESNHKNGVTHIDEGVTNVAVILQIDWQVKEVVPTLVLHVNALQKHLLRVLVRYVLNHHRCTLVVSVHNQLEIQAERPLLLLLRSVVFRTRHTVAEHGLIVAYRETEWCSF